MKGAYQYIRDAWKKPYNLEDWKKRLIEWRRGNSIVRIENPTRIDRARSLGYKAKKGFIVVRVRLMRGGRKRPKRVKGRKNKRQTIRKILLMNHRWVAEQRAEREFNELVALNSYWVAQDGIYCWYEVILVDPNRPEIKNDPKMKWILSNRDRAIRGLTSAARKSKGLR